MTDHKLPLSKSVGPIYPQPDSTSDNMGFTLIELLMVVALIGILATLSIPGFKNYTNKTKNGRAASEIRTLSTEISGYALDKGSNPTTLADINRPNFKDPWKRDYVYYNFAAIPPPPLPVAPAAQAQLKDSVDDIINTDFDLYSLGQDGATDAQMVGFPVTDDDITRYNNGAYVGLR